MRPRTDRSSGTAGRGPEEGDRQWPSFLRGGEVRTNLIILLPQEPMACTSQGMGLEALAKSLHRQVRRGTVWAVRDRPLIRGRLSEEPVRMIAYSPWRGDFARQSATVDALAGMTPTSAAHRTRGGRGGRGSWSTDATDHTAE